MSKKRAFDEIVDDGESIRNQQPPSKKRKLSHLTSSNSSQNTPIDNMTAPKSEPSQSTINEIEEKKKDETEDMKATDIIIPEPNKGILDKLRKEIATLYEYKCKHKINNDGSVTFWPTPNCEPSNKSLKTNKVSMDCILQKLYCKSAVAYSNCDDQIIQESINNGDNTCSFIVSSLIAWSEHYPFRFKPQHIWLLILQAVAVHVDQNAEKLRKKYVKHSGKMELKVEVSANPSSEEWMNTIPNFINQIDKNTVDDTSDLFDCDFSKSTLTEQIATKVTIMDICKNYFEYICYTKCGFPEITIDGRKEDWIKLKRKAIKLLDTKVDKRFGKQWSKALLPILDRFIVAFDGNIDCCFWNSMIKRGSSVGSGGYNWYCGWMNVLFPILKDEWNRFCEPYSMNKSYVEQGLKKWGNKGGGGDIKEYPMSIASAPVTWIRFGREIPLRFVAGFVGFKQDIKTLEICPNVSWCIAYSLSKKEIQDAEDKKKPRYGW